MNISTMPPPMPPPPPRRPYKRVSPSEWEQQKDHVRALFMDQTNTYESIVDTLKDRYDFDIGLRQLKRKMDEWGFTRNIPKKEMQKMVCKRKRREDELGKATKFLRRHGGGEFQDVCQDKLDKFERRFGITAASPMSISTAGTPSNIVYHTPSNDHPTPRSHHSGSTRAEREATIEFNDSVEQIFGNGRTDGVGRGTSSPSPSIRSLSLPPTSGAVPSYNHSISIQETARDNAFDGDYKAACLKYRLAGLGLARIYGSSDWQVVTLEFKSAIMKAAEFDGCPQTLAARITQELSRFLMRERQKYIHSADRGSTRSMEMRTTLASLKMTARFWCRVLVQQRAVKLWEPILGSDNTKVGKMRDNIGRLKAIPPVDLNEDSSRIEEEEACQEGVADLNNFAELRPVVDLLHLDDESPDELLRKFQALERCDIAGLKLREDLTYLRFGRSRSMLGGYYSFLERYDEAEKAFQDSARYMKHEMCTEIKLHRILWYAEHKTRTKDWVGMGTLLAQAHDVFMKNEKASNFIITHFPNRFKLLCKAASERAPIDQFANGPGLGSDLELDQGQASTPPVSSPNFLPPTTRLFPLTPRGFNSTISVDAWRQFVEFSPAAG